MDNYSAAVAKLAIVNSSGAVLQPRRVGDRPPRRNHAIGGGAAEAAATAKEKNEFH